MVPDYYAILEIDSRADRAAIETAIEAKRRIWSSGTRNPKYKHAYQSYLDQIPTLRTTLLGDPSTRAAYDAELEAGRRAERDRKLDDLQRLVKLRSAKGGLTVTDRSVLRERVKTLGLEPSDLDRLVEGIPPRPDAPPEDDVDEPTGPSLDSVMRRQIRSALDHLGKRDLYDALGVTRDAPASEIKARSDEERDRWMKKSQVTAEKTVWLEVVSHAQSQLIAKADRERYDRTLVAENEEAFVETAQFTLEGLRSLDSATRAVLLHEAASLGIPTDRADRLLGRVCKSKGVARDGFTAGGPIPVVPRTIRCRSCGGLNDYATASRQKQPECRHCRASLQWACPTCKTVNWMDDAVCRCKFPVEHLEPLIRHFEAAQKAHKDRDYATALTHLERVLEFAPGHAGARKGIGLIEERRAAISDAKAAFQRARARRAMLTARNTLEEWAKLVRPGDQDLAAAAAEVNDAIRDAIEFSSRAHALESTDPRAARELYRRSIQCVADGKDAREGLLRCPPDPPTRLVATFEGDRFVLRWTPPSPDDVGPVSFVVVRKVGDAPRSVGDGTKLTQTASTEFEDRSPPHGERVGYAVFSVRGQAVSTEAATSPPAAALAEVADIHVEARSREVLMTWVRPLKAKETIVYRRDLAGGPEISVPCSAEGLFDRDLADEKAYRYRIVSIYAGSDGRTVESRGVEVTARPHAPIAPLPAPNLSVETEGVILRWTPPSVGRVRIVRSARPLSFPPGATIAASRLDGEAIEWLDDGRPDMTVDGSPPTHGLCRYTPLTVGPDGLTVGHAATYSSIKDPSELRAVRVGTAGRVHLRWRWSPHATETIVAAKRGSPPTGPDDPEAIVHGVLDSDYGRQGFHAFMLPPGSSGTWHIAVFTAVGNGEDRVVSPGIDPSSRTVVPGPNPEVTLSYSLKRQGFTGKSWTLTFRTDPPGSDVPPTVLTAHARTVPLSAEDGEIVERFPCAADGTSFSLKTKLDLARYRVRLFADPAADPAGLPPIRLRHPEAAVPRV